MLMVAAIAAVVYIVLAMYVVQIEILTMEQRFVMAICFVFVVFLSGFFTYLIMNDENEMQELKQRDYDYRCTISGKDHTIKNLERELKQSKQDYAKTLSDLRRFESYIQHVNNIEIQTAKQISNGEKID
jgi:peptidoglycan hydrolase CwlO-like protein